MQSEFVQDVFDAWAEKIDQCQEEERSIQFEVWFVDHDRERLQCIEPRKVRLFEDYTTWEQLIKNSWREL